MASLLCNIWKLLGWNNRHIKTSLKYDNSSRKHCQICDLIALFTAGWNVTWKSKQAQHEYLVIDHQFNFFPMSVSKAGVPHVLHDWNWKPKIVNHLSKLLNYRIWRHPSFQFYCYLGISVKLSSWLRLISMENNTSHQAVNKCIAWCTMKVTSLLLANFVFQNIEASKTWKMKYN